MASPIKEEADALVSLEERILRAVDLVNSLRQEKQAVEAKLETALAEREATSKASEDYKVEIELLQEELESFRTERQQVRGRIEKLLGQLDNIGG